MFRTKLIPSISALVCTICLLFTTGCSQHPANTSDKKIEEMLMLDALAEDNLASSNIYQTTEVFLGDISETDAAAGSVSFPVSYEITHGYDYGTVTFQAFYNRSLGTTFVAKDEIIAVLKLNIEPIEKEEARIKYEKAQQAYETSLERKTKELDNLLKNIDEESNIYQKQILELDYEVARKAYEEYIAAQTEYLEELRTTMELYNNESSEIYLTSPCDGLLRTTSGFSAGDVVSPDTVLATVNSLEKIVVNARTTEFNYGTLVEIMFPSSTPLVLQGKVISADNILYNADCNYTTIEIISELPDFSSLGNQALNRLTIVANIKHATNSLLIPASALKSHKDNTGVVYVHKNGSIIKTNIKFGYRGKDYVWVLEGLEPGQEVTTK